MKDMIRPAALIMTFLLLPGLAGCNKKEDNGIKETVIKETTVKEGGIGELKKHEGPMLVIESSSAGECTAEEYEASKCKIAAYYSGEAYNPNPFDQEYTMMDDEDYIKIYDFCVDAVETDRFKDRKETADDGTSYLFTFYDLQGTPYQIYSGNACDEITELKDIEKTIIKYAAK